VRARARERARVVVFGKQDISGEASLVNGIADLVDRAATTRIGVPVGGPA
jgi:hypothetical protein